jgi:hypothetical protein
MATRGGRRGTCKHGVCREEYGKGTETGLRQRAKELEANEAAKSPVTCSKDVGAWEDPAPAQQSAAEIAAAYSLLPQPTCTQLAAVACVSPGHEVLWHWYSFTACTAAAAAQNSGCSCTTAPLAALPCCTSVLTTARQAPSLRLNVLFSAPQKQQAASCGSGHRSLLYRKGCWNLGILRRKQAKGRHQTRHACRA